MKEVTLKGLAGCSLPPRGGSLDLVRPGKDECAKIVILSPVLELYKGHWDGRKTIAHQEDDSLCPHCLKQLPSRVYGFAHVLDMETGKEGCIMLTPDGCYNLIDAAAKHPRMRGFVCEMRRHRNRKTAPYVFFDRGHLDEERIGLKAKSCEPTVRRIWYFEGLVDPRAVRG